METIKNALESKYEEMKERFQKLYSVMGLRFMIVIVIIEHLLQGFVFGGGAGGIIGAPMIYLMKNHGLVSSRIQVLQTVAVSPWALKPLFGIISDTFYIAGYNKLPYILVTLVLSIISALIIGLIAPISPLVLTVLLFFLFLQIAVADLLLEAKYSEKTRNYPKVAADLVAFVAVGGHIGQIFSIILVGIAVTFLSELHYLYLVAVPFLLGTIYPIYANWLEDNRYGSGDEEPPLSNILYRYVNFQYRAKGRYSHWIPMVAANLVKVVDNYRVFILSLIITAISLTSSLIGLLGVSSLVLFIFSLSSSVVMAIAFFFLIDRKIALIQIFVIIQNTFSISLDSASFFFYTDSPAQYPEGPHFSNFFYVTVMGLIGVCFGLLSHVFYNLFMTGWKFRKVLIISNVLSIVVSLPSVFFYLRWNVMWGFPDSLFVIGSGTLSVITNTWTMMPLIILMINLCPKGMEATVFALLAGTSNLGGSLSQYQGAFLLEVFGCNPSGSPNESSQFHNLWIVQLIASLLPILPILTIPFLIPDAYQTDPILTVKQQEEEEEQEEARPELGG